MTLSYKFKKNINKLVDPSKPVLLALSGGPDSLTLLHLLTTCKQVNFAVAHVDHGWRPESGGEAELLKQMVEKLSVPFYLKKLDVNCISGNLEEYCRRERLSFFKELCLSHGYQGVLLGHHADDQSETVLKRVFEGASLIHLGAMKQVSHYEGIALFRPLLNILRAEILEYIKEEELSPFDDMTNYNPKYMRARLRLQTLPFLKEQFGKNINKGLLNLAKESQEVEAYLDRKIMPYLHCVVEAKMGLFLDFNALHIAEVVELRHLLKRLCTPNLSLSKEQYDSVCTLIFEGAANRKVTTGEGTIFIDRSRLFIMKKNRPSWTVRIENTKENSSACSSWKDLWEGRAHVILPQGEYTVGSCISSEKYPRTHSINKWWTDHKVPAFMRTLVPVVRDRNGICHEFLTGKRKDLLLDVHNTLISIDLC